MITIRFAESAMADLRELKRSYAEQGVPDVGERLVAEISHSIEALKDNPDIGRIVPELAQPFLGELIHPPFRIVYRRDPQQVRVVRVCRSERLLQLQPDGG